MNTIKSKTKLFFYILLPFCSMIVTSCEKKIQEQQKPKQQIQEQEPVNSVSTKVSETLITQIAESNLKIVAIAQKAREGKIKKSTKIVLEQVEKDHSELKDNIKKIAKNNYIIIPNTLYDTTTLKSFISEVNISMYLKKLHVSLSNELNLYQNTTLTTTNEELKKFTKDALPVIKANIASILKEQNTNY
ncbi:hypothetical protein [Flavobacterium flavipallidum]|uniref:DUF4142 domain-containing protein n=1 Tax=Flavobacterium flavipallidum TaxID=3139140 RepID=A0ABU9HNY8_9FLAO